MEKLESVGTTPSHVAVSDRADAHRSGSDNPKSGRRARHGVSTTGCPSIVDLFPDTLDLGSSPIRPASWGRMVPSDSGSPCTVSESWRRDDVPRESSQTATRRPLLHPRRSGIPSCPHNPPPASVWIGNEQNDRGG